MKTCSRRAESRTCVNVPPHCPGATLFTGCVFPARGRCVFGASGVCGNNHQFKDVRRNNGVQPSVRKQQDVSHTHTHTRCPADVCIVSLGLIRPFVDSEIVT